MARRDPRNFARYWRDRRLPGLALLKADFTTQSFALHAHDALVIAVTEFGGAEVKSRGEIQRAEAATVFAFNPAEPHAGWMGWSQRWRYRSLYLTQSALDAVAEGLGLAEVPYFTRNRFDDADLVDGFIRLHRALEQGGDALAEEELLLGAFGLLFARHGSASRPMPPAPGRPTPLDRALDLMQACHHRPLPLDMLAAAAGLSKTQLIAAFQRRFGMGPHGYLTQIRLRAACRRLKRGEALAEAAQAAGFYDQSAMTRHFKRAYGITPREYARWGRGA